MRDPAHTRAVGLLLLASLCWSLGGLLIKYVQWPPLAVAGGRGLIAALFLIAVIRPRRWRFSRLQWIAAGAYAACTITFVLATKLTTAANAILLQYTAPVWIALLSAWLLGEKTQRSDWLTILVVLGGMTLFFAEDGLSFAHAGGNVVAALSGVAFATMTLAMRKQKDGSPAESIILGNLLAFAAGLPWILTAPTLPADGWAALVTLGVVQLGVSYWLYARAIKHVTALEAVIIPVIEPILNPIWVQLRFGERPSPLALVGGLIVLGAVTLRAVHSLRTARPPATAPSS